MTAFDDEQSVPGEAIDRADLLAEYIPFLNAVKGLYPFGIPAEAIVDEDVEKAKAKADKLIAKLREQDCLRGKGDTPLLFLGCEEQSDNALFSSQADELLYAAISKGMKLAVESPFACNIKKLNASGKFDSEALLRAFNVTGISTVIILGEESCKLVFGAEEANFIDLRSRWQNLYGLKVIPTYDLRAVLGSPAAKKIFWQDLKQVMKEMGIAK